MKKPDEIKKALECCFNASQCGDCPYYPISCDRELVRDAREYIRQLEAERDALMTFMQKECYYCKHNFSESPDCPCLVCEGESHFEWRGAQKED